MKAYVEVVASRPKPQDRLRKGENKPVKTGRAARVRVGRFMSKERQLDVLGRLAMRLNAAAGVVTVADELRLRGADPDLVRRYASPVGRKFAASFRTATDMQPASVGVGVLGSRIGPVFGYADADRPLLAAVIDGYEVKTPVRARLLDLIAERAAR